MLIPIPMYLFMHRNTTIYFPNEESLGTFIYERENTALCP